MTETLAVEIPYEDLEAIRQALSYAHNHSITLDLAEGYRRLAATPPSSKLTQGLSHALVLITAHLDLSGADDDQ